MEDKMEENTNMSQNFTCLQCISIYNIIAWHMVKR